MIELLIWSGSIIFISYILYRFLHGPFVIVGEGVDLTGKIVIVTGSNAGIGKETALHLLSKGANVIFACRNEESAMNVINSIANASQKKNAMFIRIDLTDFESIKQFVNQFKAKFGNLDILINNVGGLNEALRKVENIEHTFMFNYLGHLVLTHMLIPYMNDYGRIINMSSVIHYTITQEQFNSFINDYEFKQLEQSYNIFFTYSMAKMANYMHAKHLNDYFISHNMKIKATTVHPGHTNSGIPYKININILKQATALSRPFLAAIFKRKEELILIISKKIVLIL
jgi:NAD(P)-dependent dehydrogenase (short-subunit alcohol dehydrogenase family)